MSNYSKQNTSRSVARSPWVASLIGAIVLAGCASGSDRPQDGDRQGGPGAAAEFSGMASRPISLLFSDFDTNSDRLVTGDELIAGIELEWAGIEKTGAITPISFKSWQAAALGSEEAFPAFLSFDRNLNSELSAEEFEEGIRQEFIKMDRDADGVLTRAELTFRIRRPQRGQARGQQQGGRGQGQGGRGGGGRGGPPGGGRGG